MKLEEIKSLIQMLEQSSLTALELCQGNDRIRLERNYAAPCSAVSPIVTATPTTAALSAEPQPIAAPENKPQSHGKAITSPLVGVFYAAPSPDDAPYVQVGSPIKKGDVLCLVEAMKLMNEITAEQDGVIAEICVENGQVVEYGQPLFYLA